MKVKKVNWYGFDHKKVSEKFKKHLVYINDFCVNKEYQPVAVYYDPKPDKKIGHKSYLLLSATSETAIVRGMGKREINKYRYQTAIHCKQCDMVIYSANRHHYNTCECTNEASIDGGKDYIRCSAKDLSKIEYVTLDLLTDKIIKNKQ